MEKNVSLKLLIISHILALLFLLFAVFGFPRLLLFQNANSIRPMKMSQDLETVFYGFGNHDSTRTDIFEYKIDSKKYPKMIMNLEKFQNGKWTTIRRIAEGSREDPKGGGEEDSGIIGITYSPEKGGQCFSDGITYNLESSITNIPKGYLECGSFSLYEKTNCTEKICLMAWHYSKKDNETSIPDYTSIKEWTKLYKNNKDDVLIAITLEFQS